MADDPNAPTPEFANAAANIQAQQRGALAALAKGGSQGLAAYQSAIAQSGGLKQAALNAAAHRAALIGGPEASSASITNPIVQGANIAQQNLQAGSSALQDFTRANTAATNDYFNRASASVPTNELAFLRAQLASGSKNSMSEADRNAQILGSAQQDAADAKVADDKAAADYGAQGKTLGDQAAAAKKAQDEAYAAYGKAKQTQRFSGYNPAAGDAMTGPNAPVKSAVTKQLLAEATAKAKAYQAIQAQADAYGQQSKPAATARSLSDYAQQEAQKNNLTPAQAKVLYGDTGTKFTEFQQQQMKANTAGDQTQIKAWAGGGSIDPQVLKDAQAKDKSIQLTKGKLSQEDFIKLVNVAHDPDTAAYLVGQFAKSFKTQAQLKKGK